MALADILSKFNAEMDAHRASVEDALTAKVAAADKAIHDKWDAMGADLASIEAKIVAAQAQLSMLEGDIAAATGFALVSATGLPLAPAAPVINPVVVPPSTVTNTVVATFVAPASTVITPVVATVITPAATVVMPATPAT
jgi:hypothetical protein